jgi:hypothetical protein
MQKLSILLLTVIISQLLYLKQTEARIGDVTELNGQASVTRNKKEQPIGIRDGIESMDTISTKNSKVRIDFIDKTHVSVTEHSDLEIDEYVFDPSRDLAKLSMKVSSGTVQYASGLLAKKVGAVDVRTPTASIAVRGTEFSMSVNELGKSLIMLLPNQDGSTGEITVSTDVASVILNKSYQATIVTSSSSPPSNPLILNMLGRVINNDLLLSMPKSVETVSNVEKEQGPLDFDLKFVDVNMLDKDPLKFEELTVDLLKSDFFNTRLSNIDSIFDNFSERDGQVTGYNPTTQINTVVEDTTVLTQRLDISIFSVKVNKDYGLKIEYNGDGISAAFVAGNIQSNSILKVKQK